MEITLLFFPLVATFLLLTDFKDPVNRWGSLSLLFISLGGLYSLTDHFFAGIFREITNPILTSLLKDFILLLLFKTPLCLFPVAILIFTFHYYHSDHNRGWQKKPSKIVAILIPAFIMYLLPLNPLEFSSLRRFLIIIDLWALPYMVVAYHFLFKSIISDNRKLKTDKLLTVVTIIIISLFYMIAVYLLPLLRYTIFKFNPYLVIGFLGLLPFIALKYGFLGYKVTVGDVYLDNAIKTVGSGVAAINHNIRDRLFEISACATNIVAAKEETPELIVENTNTILAVTDQISNVIEKLHHFLDRINIIPTKQNLAEIVIRAVNFFETQIQEKELKISNNLPQEVTIWGDPLYLAELLKNILQNSIEAMEKGGAIRIDLTRFGEKVTLIITDTGCGIPHKDLARVLEPFYTTKDPGSHFGLGLSYCYNIMQQHGGSLEIESSEKTGTTVLLKFPGKRIIS
jgi:two-component system sporulation sensor kinase B